MTFKMKDVNVQSKQRKESKTYLNIQRIKEYGKNNLCCRA